MSKYGQYSAAVKTVQLVAEQAANGWHLSEHDLEALKNAIADMQSLYDVRSNPKSQEAKK